MTNNLKILLLLLNNSDPNLIVKCDMDSFTPYTYIELTPDFTQLIQQLSDEEKRTWDYVENEYLEWIKDGTSVVNEHIQQLINN